MGTPADDQYVRSLHSWTARQISSECDVRVSEIVKILKVVLNFRAGCVRSVKSRTFFDMIESRRKSSYIYYRGFNTESNIRDVVNFTMRLCVPSQIMVVRGRGHGGREERMSESYAGIVIRYELWPPLIFDHPPHLQVMSACDGEPQPTVFVRKRTCTMLSRLPGVCAATISFRWRAK
jgi:hypothetical protein